MRFLAFLLLSGFSGLAFGQVMFPTDDAEWIVRSNSPILGPNDDYRVWRYVIEGDTVIGGSTYSQVWLQPLCYSVTNQNEYKAADPSYKASVAWVRADADRIYAIIRSFPKALFSSYGNGVKSFPVDTLLVIADFSVQQGDTVNYPTGTALKVVDKTILPDGRRSVTLEQMANPPFQSTWLEGQGCTKGLFETTFYWFDYGACFQTPVGAGLCTVPCTPVDPVLVNTAAPEGPGEIRVFPNPVTDILHLSISPSMVPMDLTVWDVQGKPVWTHRVVRDQDDLDLTVLAPGSYMCQLVGSRGEPRMFKLIRLP